MIDIKVTPLSGGKIKVQVKIYEVSNSTNPRFSLSSSLKPRIYWGRSKQTKKLIFNEYLHLKNTNSDREILKRWITIKGLNEHESLIFAKYDEYFVIYGDSY